MSRQVEVTVVKKELLDARAWLSAAWRKGLSVCDLLQENRSRVRCHVWYDLSGENALLKALTVQVTGEAEHG